MFRLSKLPKLFHCWNSLPSKSPNQTFKSISFKHFPFRFFPSQTKSTFTNQINQSEHDDAMTEDFSGEILHHDIPGLLRFRNLIHPSTCSELKAELANLPEQSWQRVENFDMLSVDYTPEGTCRKILTLLYEMKIISRVEICSVCVVRLGRFDFMRQSLEEFVVFDGEGISCVNLGEDPMGYSVRDSRSAAQMKVFFDEGDLFVFSGEVRQWIHIFSLNSILI